jgi:hypothetical protein
LIDSKEKLSSILECPVDSLSLPYGEYTAREIAQAEAAGYRFVFSNVPVWKETPGKILRGRVSVEPDDWPLEFWLKIRGGYGWMAITDFLHQVRGWKRVPVGQAMMAESEVY